MKSNWQFYIQVHATCVATTYNRIWKNLYSGNQKVSEKAESISIDIIDVLLQRDIFTSHNVDNKIFERNITMVYTISQPSIESVTDARDADADPSQQLETCKSPQS